jgi:hypothetical protein
MRLRRQVDAARSAIAEGVEGGTHVLRKVVRRNCFRADSSLDALRMRVRHGPIRSVALAAAGGLALGSLLVFAFRGGCGGTQG